VLFTAIIASLPFNYWQLLFELIILQGRVRTKTVKRSARVIVERYYMKLATDFHLNKRVCDDVATLPSKRMRNKIAGFITVRTP